VHVCLNGQLGWDSCWSAQLSAADRSGQSHVTSTGVALTGDRGQHAFWHSLRDLITMSNWELITMSNLACVT
jgi:hypothetical protein